MVQEPGHGSRPNSNSWTRKSDKQLIIIYNIIITIIDSNSRCRPMPVFYFNPCLLLGLRTFDVSDHLRGWSVARVCEDGVKEVKEA
jgi:hypothetical protein